jgi:dipeptidyl aminopeptidase/acylaminoacyl peptidase
VKDIGARPDDSSSRPSNHWVLLGVSYGGWLALESGIVYNDRIRGIIEGAGQTNFITYLEQTEAARQENRRREFGDERDPEMRQYLLSISPVTRAGALKKPTYILHPGKDVLVPVSQAQELMKALKANNAMVWYAEFTDATHDTLPGGAAEADFMLASWMWFFKTFVLN